MRKNIIKSIGKRFVDLKQVDGKIFKQSILIVDNGYSWIGHIGLAIQTIRKYFPKADISILTSQDRKANIEKEFSDIIFILPSEGLRPHGYRIALEMLLMKEKRYDFIVLLSMAITSLISSQFFFRSKVILYNQWGQWWFLGFRKVSNVFKAGYSKKKTRFGLKNLFKRIGLFFILLERVDETIFKRSILVVDNENASYDQIGYGIQRIKEFLPEAKISVLGISKRKELEYNFPDLEIIQPGKGMIAKCSIARHMFKLRRDRYDCIILLSLDVMPIIVSMLFMKGRKALFNHWKQWWLLEPKSIKGYFAIIPQFIINIILFIYLLVSVFWIFLKRSINVVRFSFSKKNA